MAHIVVGTIVICNMNDLCIPKSVTTGRVSKTTTLCWGCGVEQGRGERFKQCPACVRALVIPARFCSNECYMASWNRHRAWHVEQKKQLSQVVLLPSSPRSVALDAFAQKSEYNAHLANAKRLINMLNLAGAQKELRKAVHLDDSRPEAYFDLAVCSEASGQWKHAAFYYERSIERLALVDLTTDHAIEGAPSSCALRQWATAIEFVTRLYLTREFGNHPKPAWFVVDGLLKIVAKTAAKQAMADSESTLKQIVKLSLLQSFALSGIVSNGRFHTESVLHRHASSQELLEAASCFRFVVTAAQTSGRSSEVEFSSREVAAYSSHVRTCTNLAQLKAAEEAKSSSRPDIPQVGSWVSIQQQQHDHSLPSLLKFPFGQVVGAQDDNGKVPVKVHDLIREGTQLISPVSLVKIVQSTQVDALVACLESDHQWAFMSTAFGTFSQSPPDE